MMTGSRRHSISNTGVYVEDSDGEYDGDFVNILEYFPDLFQITISHRMKTTRTVFGQVASLIWAILLLYFVVFSTSRFLEQKPIVVDAATPSDYEPVPAPPAAIVLIYNGAPFYNESYFYYRFSARTYLDSGAVRGPRRPLPSAPCAQFFDNNDLKLHNFHCADLRGEIISGEFNLPRFDFIEYAVIRCEPNSGANSSAVPCASNEDIDRIVYGGSFNVLSQGASVTTDSAVIVSQRVQLNPLLYQSQDMFYSKLKRIEQSRTTLNTHTSYTVAGASVSSYFQGKRDYDFFKLFLRLSPEQIERRVTPISLWDLLGGWAAVGSFLLPVLGLLAYVFIYNIHLRKTEPLSLSELQMMQRNSDHSPSRTSHSHRMHYASREHSRTRSREHSRTLSHTRNHGGDGRESVKRESREHSRTRAHTRDDHGDDGHEMVEHDTTAARDRGHHEHHGNNKNKTGHKK